MCVVCVCVFFCFHATILKNRRALWRVAALLVLPPPQPHSAQPQQQRYYNYNYDMNCDIYIYMYTQCVCECVREPPIHQQQALPAHNKTRQNTTAPRAHQIESCCIHTQRCLSAQSPLGLHAYYNACDALCSLNRKQASKHRMFAVLVAAKASKQSSSTHATHEHKHTQKKNPASAQLSTTQQQQQQQHAARSTTASRTTRRYDAQSDDDDD
jgi:hypothetical protein